MPQTVGEETRAGKVDDEEVDDELGDLQRREVLLPLRRVSEVPFWAILANRAHPDLGAAGGGVVVVVCDRERRSLLDEQTVCCQVGRATHT